MDLRRRITTLAALFELADGEFVSVRSETTKLEQLAAAESSTQNPVAPEEGLDAFHFLSVAGATFRDYPFIPGNVDGFVQEIRVLSPDFTTRLLEAALTEHIDLVNQYAEYQKTNLNTLNPYTRTRHALYLSNKEVFRRILFDRQRDNFEKWLSEKAV